MKNSSCLLLSHSSSSYRSGCHRGVLKNEGKKRDTQGNKERNERERKNEGRMRTRCTMLSIGVISQLWDLAVNIWLAQIFLFSSDGKHSTNDVYIRALFCDWCENHRNSWRRIGSDECCHLGVYLTAPKVLTSLVLESKEWRHDIDCTTSHSFFFWHYPPERVTVYIYSRTLTAISRYFQFLLL